MGIVERRNRWNWGGARVSDHLYCWVLSRVCSYGGFGHGVVDCQRAVSGLVHYRVGVLPGGSHQSSTVEYVRTRHIYSHHKRRQGVLGRY